jgi:hypothetical protein
MSELVPGTEFAPTSDQAVTINFKQAGKATDA